MRINKVSFKELCGQTAFVDTSKGKNLIIGTHASGKTTRLTALEIAVLGYVPRFASITGLGVQPGTTMRLASGDAMVVDVEISNDFSFSRTFLKTATGASSTTTTSDEMVNDLKKADVEKHISGMLGVFPASLDISGEFLWKSPEQRRAFLRPLMPNQDMDVETELWLAAYREALGSEVVEAIAETALGSEYAETMDADLIATLLDLCATRLDKKDSRLAGMVAQALQVNVDGTKSTDEQIAVAMLTIDKKLKKFKSDEKNARAIVTALTKDGPNTALVDRIPELTGMIEKADEDLMRVSGAIEATVAKQEVFETCQEMIDEATKKIDILAKSMPNPSEVEGSIEKIGKEIEAMVVERSRLNKTLKERNAKLGEIMDSINSKKENVAKAQGAMAAVPFIANYFTDLNCDNCGKPVSVSDDIVGQIQSEIQKGIDEELAETSVLEKNYAALNERCALIADDLDAKKAELSKREAEELRLKTELENIPDRIETIEREIAALQEDVLKNTQTRQDYSPEDTDLLGAEKKSLEAALEALKKQLGDAQEGAGVKKKVAEAEVGVLMAQKAVEAAKLVKKAAQAIQAKAVGALAESINKMSNRIIKQILPDAELSVVLESGDKAVFDIALTQDGKTRSMAALSGSETIVSVHVALALTFLHLKMSACKVLTIEAAELNPKRLKLLMRTLGKLVDDGMLDNAMVAHWTEDEAQFSDLGWTVTNLGG